MTSTSNECSIYHCSTGQRHHAEERMFGWGDPFKYFECGDCGCLQLVEPPEDLGKYYPPGEYYSYHVKLASSVLISPWRRWLRRKRNEAQLSKAKGLMGKIAKKKPAPGIELYRPWFCENKNIHLQSRLLDVGCGNGVLLSSLANLGFESLTGVDPFLSDETAPHPLRLFVVSLEEFQEADFELIMFHHSFEHLPDPLTTLKATAAKLSPDGVCLIRIPIATAGPWKRYGTHWVELDAPRHFHLHTERSLDHLAKQCGLKIVRTEYEETAFPYAGSELYLRDKPLFQNGINLIHQEFTTTDFKRFEQLSNQDVEASQAGRAAFYLKRDPELLKSEGLS